MFAYSRGVEKFNIPREYSKQIVLFLGLLGLLFYSTSWKNNFVSDDYNFVGRISFSDCPSYFLKSWGYGNEYRPVLPFTYALDSAIGGESPVAFHITNTVLHLAAALLLGMTACNFGVPFSLSLLASIIFFLNPVVHESVIWISGRPVLLGALFMLLSIWAFSRFHKKPSRALYISSLLFFLLGLLSYEGAASLPFLLFILVWSTRGASRKSMFLLGPYLLLLLAYILFWNILFGGEITRFPVESTVPGALRSFTILLKRAFYGSSHGIPAAFYVLLFINLLLTSKSRKWCIPLFAMIVAGYLPFFIVQGYADRFAYVASIPVAVLLAWMIVHAGRGRWAKMVPVVLSACLVVYYGYSMQGRIGQWRQAGKIAGNITAGIKRLQPDLPRDALVYVNGVPEMYKDAYVFITGLEPAVRRAYDWAPLRVMMNATSTASSADIYRFQYSDGRVREIPSSP